jgi:hypothetical protein
VIEPVEITAKRVTEWPPGNRAVEITANRVIEPVEITADRVIEWATG